MNQLLPIIRRVRRPLLPPEEPPVVVAKAEQPKAEAETLKPEGSPTTVVNEAPAGTPATARETVAAPLANVLPGAANHATDTPSASAE